MCDNLTCLSHTTKPDLNHCLFITSYKQATCVRDSCCKWRIFIGITEEFWGLITYCCYSAVKMQDAKHWQGLSAAWKSRQAPQHKEQETYHCSSSAAFNKAHRKVGNLQVIELSRGSLAALFQCVGLFFFSSPQRRKEICEENCLSVQ